MKRQSFKGWHKVFAFTFKNIAGQKSFIALTTVICLILFLLPAVIMPITELNSGKDDMDKEYPCNAEEIFVVMTDAFSQEFEERYLLEAAFADPRFPNMSGIKYTPVKTLDDALEKGKNNPKSLIIYLTKENKIIENSVILPQGTELSKEDGENYSAFLSNYFPFLFLPESNLNLSQLASLLLPTVSGNVEAESEEETRNQAISEVLEIFRMVIPYVIIMFLYFMVLFYGQNISGSVLLEKTSKLVDSMLLSIPPEAMILGKVLSGAAAAIIQFVIWLLSIIAGFGIGTAIVKLINPDTDMFIVLFFDSLDSLSGIFSLPAILLSVVIVLLGFLMYCTLASISGAMASKQEDLSSTQSIFVLILVFSFYVSLQGFFTGDGAATAQWADYLPFTAILTVPGKLMLSEISLLEGGISIGILTLTCLLFIVCAGKIYRSLVFYKGNVPKIKDVIAIILNKQ